MIAGRHPHRDGQRPENDCCIIESLIRFFGDQPQGARLLFCTENLRDFGLEMQEKNIANLHRSLATGMPAQTSVLTNLRSLVEFLRSPPEEVREPTSEEVDEAWEREKANRVEEELDREKEETPVAPMLGHAHANYVAVRSAHDRRALSIQQANSVLASNRRLPGCFRKINHCSGTSVRQRPISRCARIRRSEGESAEGKAAS